MKIKELPNEERPREKALRYGINTLSNSELFAIILGSGTKNMNVLELATNLLSAIGGIKGLGHATYHTLKKINGIKEAKALMLASIGELYRRIDTNHERYEIGDIIEKYVNSIKNETQEKVIIIPSKNGINPLFEKLLYIGVREKVLISIKDILREVYSVDARYFYLIHTHPHSLSFPSKEDIITFKHIKEECASKGIYLINLYIIGTDGYSDALTFTK